MKRNDGDLLRMALALLAIGAGMLGLMLAGCAAAPRAWESRWYDVSTNPVPVLVVRTNYVTLTNVVEQVVTRTNEQQVVVTVTNLVPMAVTITNRVVETNWTEQYGYAPNTNAAALVGTVRRTGNLFGPWGELAGVILGGIIAGYGLVRSSRANKTAAVLAQVIETGREVLARTPQGQAIDAEWVQWMTQHQAETGTLREVMRLLESVVDEPSAREAARQIGELIDERTNPAKKT